MAENPENSTSSFWDNDIKLVLEVKERRCLYDKTSKIYRSFEARQKAWEEISEIMQIPVAACASKWKTIRDRYVRVYKRSGSGAADVIEDPSWLVSKYLSSLNPSITTKRGTGNYPEFPSQTGTESQDSQELTLYEVDESSNAASVQGSSSSGGSTPSQESPEDGVVAETSMAQASTSTLEPTVTPVVPGKRRRFQQSTMESVLQALHAPVVVHLSGPAPQEDSQILHFLKSLQDDMGRASPRALRNIKVGMIQLIGRELERDSTQSD